MRGSFYGKKILVVEILIAFVVVFVLNQPMLDVGIMSGSKMKDKVLKSTPVLTQIVSNVGNTIEDVSKLMQDKSYEKEILDNLSSD